jgi:putative FmdB family regulatory protein
MPIYEYVCRNCGEKFELRRGITDSDSEAECPKCGVANPRRILSTSVTLSSRGACAPGSST